MYRLNLPQKPFWLEVVPGVRFKVRPPNTARAESASHRAGAKIRDLVELAKGAKDVGATYEGPDLEDEHERFGVSQMVLVTALAQDAILEWEGILDAEGNPAPVSDENIAQAMQIPAIATPFFLKYHEPLDRLRDEGNALRPAQNGITATGRDTAQDAESSAPPAAKENEASRESSAHTSSTRRKRSTASRHGIS